MIRSLLLAGALVSAPAGASAAALVLGEGLARDCSQAAMAGRADQDTLALCSRALDEENLVKRDRAGTLVNRGVTLMRLKDYDAAETDFDKAGALEPRLGEVFVNRGVLLMGRSRYEQALAEMNRGLELGVDEPAKAYYNRALVQESLDDAKAAYMDYQQAQALAPKWDAPRRQLSRFSVKTP